MDVSIKAVARLHELPKIVNSFSEVLVAQAPQRSDLG